MLAMKRMTMERNAAAGCSVNAKPTRSVLMGAMTVPQMLAESACHARVLDAAQTGANQLLAISLRKNFSLSLSAAYSSSVETARCQLI